MALVGVITAVGIGVAIWWPIEPRPAPHGVTIVDETSETIMHPLPVEPPQELRWRDIADAPYSEDFRGEFDYRDTDLRRAEVTYWQRGPTLAGTLVLRGLKPWFAYQLKLVGARPILGAREGDNAGDVEAWSSWQLGRLGRWWCDDCNWNVADDDLAEHLREGHAVRGYLLFDWLVTDEEGACVHGFMLEGSLHVLWRADQRDAAPQDTATLYYPVERTHYGYGPDVAPGPETVGIFGEWEPGRAPIGGLTMPAGQYCVELNLTEESFHANMDEERSLSGGGFWAWVLESDL
ncbi:MAG: hypothetical protein AB7Y46_18090, partial [Armatimonadota bacterium]